MIRRKIMNLFKKSGLISLVFPLVALTAPYLFSFPLNAIEENTSGTHASHQGIVSWVGHDYSPLITPDGKFLIFLSDRPGDRDGVNYWYSTNTATYDKNGPALWTVPIALVFPFSGPGSKTMQITSEPGHVDQPAGGFSLNTDGYDGPLSIRYNSTGEPVEVFFTSDRESQRDSGYDGLNIYVTQYKDDRWTPPEHLNQINSKFDDRMPWISADGKRLIFSSNRPGGYGGYDLWESHRESLQSPWSFPVNLGSIFNTPFDENSPVLSRQGQMLFFSSNRPGGYGNFDFYVSRYDGFFWKAPENLGAPYNSPWDDEGLSFTRNGTWSYFSSDRREAYSRGGFDIYRHKTPRWLIEGVEILLTGLVLDGRTRRPLGVEATITVEYEKNTIVGTSRLFQKEPEGDLESNYAIELRSGRIYRVTFSAPGFHPVQLDLDYTGSIPPGNMDRRNIVMQPIRPEQSEDEKESRIIHGRVIDAQTQLSLPGSSVDVMVDGASYRPVEVDQNGEFFFRVKEQSSFQIYARAPDYEPLRREFVERSDLKMVIMALKKKQSDVVCPGDDPACIDNIRIYFDIDQANIEVSERASVDAIVRIMKANPELKIEIQGHTDRQYSGPESQAYRYNLELSRKRAQKVMETLIENGVDKSRLQIKGYSFLKPRIEEPKSKKSRLNRRVEFRRIKE